TYFKNSTLFFKRANAAAQTVAKKFPNYKNIGEVYYILGSNYREMGDHKSAQSFLAQAIKHTQASSPVRAKAELTLADYHYNNRRYKQAIPLYERSISKINDKWWTKESFNLAWCYYRVKNYSKAIDLMREIHRRSPSDKYIDMRSEVNRDIGIFYVEANRLNDAISFYRSQKIDFTKQMLTIAEKTMSDGQFNQSERILLEAEKNEKDTRKKVEILIAQLHLYDRANQDAKHLRVAENLVTLSRGKFLTEDQNKILVFQIDKKAAELQKTVASKTYAGVKKTQRLKADQAIKYFGLSALLNPKSNPEKVFFQGETAYASNRPKTALNHYLAAFDAAKSSKNTKIMQQSVEGMLSALAAKNLTVRTAKAYYVPVYQRALSLDQKSARAKTIYERLFAAQIEQKDYPGADQTLTMFAKNFSNDFKTQEAMLAKIMEHYRSNKEYDSVKAYVTRINSGEFKVSKKYADALRSLMTKIQIEGVQSSLDKGDKALALKGYHQIYESSESTPHAKANASYNLSALYYELGDPNKSYLWSTVALNEMDAKDVVKFSSSLLTIASGLFARQHLNQSADLSYRLLAKTCQINSSNKSNFYKNAVFISLANNEIDKALEIRGNAKKCSIPDRILKEVDHELLKDLADKNRWTALEEIVKELEKDSRSLPHLIIPYEKLRERLLAAGNIAEARNIESKQSNFYARSVRSKLDIPVEAIDLIALRMIPNIENAAQKIDSVKLSFPENVFNSALQNKLKALDALTAQVNEVTKTGSGKAIVSSSKYLIQAYENVSSEVKEFTPPDKPKEYVESFQKAMRDVWLPLTNHAAKLRKDLTATINKNSILSEDNFDVLYSGDYSDIRFFTNEEAVVMQREGMK
ncbi:MAG: tetratricopeptide repeat protein, partial [Bacteriovoracaceae bacterium]